MTDPVRPPPDAIDTEEQLDLELSHPGPEVVEAVSRTEGDFMVLGAGGKIGPSLARMLRRAADAAGGARRVIAVSRFCEPGNREKLASWGIETISCDLLDRRAVHALPRVENVLFLAGRKFGSSGDEPLTWAMNTLLPAEVAAAFAGSRIVAFSTGCVYSMVPAGSGGSRETDPTEPPGEYAWSCLGRERVFEHCSRRAATPVCLIRLNYAIDLRYGVLLDVAKRVRDGRPVDLTMSHVNVIWQGDANARAIQALDLCASPPKVLNVTGPETISIRWLAERFGEHLGTPPRFEGRPAETLWLNDASESLERFGPPRVRLPVMVRWIAHWLEIGGRDLGKPTHFEVRDGRF